MLGSCISIETDPLAGRAIGSYVRMGGFALGSEVPVVERRQQAQGERS
jgi:hypothetical protein